MNIPIKKIINSERGRIVFSILLGIGLATLFRKSCQSHNCLIFKAPSLDKIKNKVFSHNNKCYSFKEESVSCKNVNPNTLLDIDNKNNILNQI